MRAIALVGVILGSAGFLALFLLGHSVALVVAPALIIIGLLAGVCMAKWLEWAWFGRQFRAGTIAGFYACTLAGAGALIALATAGPQSVSALAAQSHLGGLNLAPVVERAGFAGWIGADVLLLLFAGLLGVFVAGLTTQVLAWSKNTRMVRVVTQARAAAEPLARRDTFLPTPSGGRAGDSILPSPRSQPGVAGPPSFPGAGWDVPAPVAPQQPAWQQSGYAPAPGASARKGKVAAPTPTPQQAIEPPLEEQPREGRLSAAEREALEAWARDNDPKPATPRKRQPKASAYLNAPAPKRSRKKQDTRDWLC